MENKTEKKEKRNQSIAKEQKGFAAKCPKSGGYCLNPLCMFGCIEY